MAARSGGSRRIFGRRFVIECKVLRDSDRKNLTWTVEQGVEQTLGYMAQCKAQEGHLVILDRRSEERRHRESETVRSGGRADEAGVVVWTL